MKDSDQAQKMFGLDDIKDDIRREMISVASVWSISVLYCAGRHAALFSHVIVIHGRTTTCRS